MADTQRRGRPSISSVLSSFFFFFLEWNLGLGYRGQVEAQGPHGEERRGVARHTWGWVGLSCPRLGEGVGSGRAVVDQKPTTWACLSSLPQGPGRICLSLFLVALAYQGPFT